MNIEKIKKALEKISIDFNLKLDETKTHYKIISIRQGILESFLSGSENPNLTNIGFPLQSPKERAEKLHKFVGTDYFKQVTSKITSCGTMIRKSRAEKELAVCQYIKEQSLKKELVNFYQEILKEYKSHRIALIAYKKGQEKVAEFVLLHEFIHRLLFDEKINFSNKKEEYWIYDEGLAEYLTFYGFEKVSLLKEINTKNKMEKIYLENAKLFYNMLKDKKTPKNRRETILNFLNNLN